MFTIFGHTLSKWATLLLVGDLIVFWLSIPFVYFLEFIVGYQVLFIQEDLVSLAFLGLVYITVLYVGELYNYYLDFRRQENIGKIILWALASSFVAFLIFCGPTPISCLAVFWNGKPWPSSGFWFSGATVSRLWPCPGVSREGSSSSGLAVPDTASWRPWSGGPTQVLNRWGLWTMTR